MPNNLEPRDRQLERSLTITAESTGADAIPLPLDQVREYHPRIEGREHATGLSERLAGISAHGVRGTGVCPLPATPETVAGYIAECAGHLKPGSIQRRLNAIAEAHKAIGTGIPDAYPDCGKHHEGNPPDAGDRAGSKSARLDGRYPGHGRRHGRGNNRRAGPGANPARVRRCIPPF